MSGFAHRPARPQGASSQFGGGGYFHGGAGTNIRSAKNLPSHQTLKVREDGQATASDVAERDLMRELEERERAHFESSRRAHERLGGARAGAPSAAIMDARAPTAGARASAPIDAILAAFDDADDDVKLRDAVAAGGGDAASASGASGGSDDDDDDDEEELMRELQRIRAEREEERLRHEREAAELTARTQSDSAARSNPLLAAALAPEGGAVKRSFLEGTVFSKTHAAEPAKKKRFINVSAALARGCGAMRNLSHP